MSGVPRMFKARVATLCIGAVLGLLLWAGSGATSVSRLAVRDAWARATPPGSSAVAVYLTVVGGSAPDRLLRVSTARAGMGQVHAVTTEAGMTRMREVASVTIPAGAAVVFAPQGLHIMLMDLTRALTVGERFTLTLEFAGAGKRNVSVDVLAPTATGPAAH